MNNNKDDRNLQMSATRCGFSFLKASRASAASMAAFSQFTSFFCDLGESRSGAAPPLTHSCCYVTAFKGWIRGDKELGEAKLKEQNANSLHNMHYARLRSLPTSPRVVVFN